MLFFTEFVLGLAQFAIRDEDSEKKLEFLFRIYDMDRDGFISNGELFQVANIYTLYNLTLLKLEVLEN